MKQICALAIIGLFVAQGFAQDPQKVLPPAYKLQFENDWVKVTRVHYAPHEKLASHAHTQTASAYVYLNDSGPVVFKHIGLSYGAVTRPATKAGSFRLYQGLQEMHEVENLSDLPSEFLRVEFKTEPINEKSLRGRFYREDYPRGENFQKVQFENEQVRITRLVCAPGKTLELTGDATEPALLISLVPSHFKLDTRDTAGPLNLELGQAQWMAVNQQPRMRNAGREPAELLRFDFKTKPLSKDVLEKNKQHEHSKASL